MHDDDLIRLRHMLDAAVEATGFVEGKTRADLDEEKMLELALVRSVEIIGEAGAIVSGQGRAEVPDIPWRGIVAMRNRLIHAYFDVNLDVLWETIENDIPSLVDILRKVLDEENTTSRRG